MDIKAMRAEKFAEELYFLLMSSPVQDRVRTLGAKHGLSGRALKDQIMIIGNRMMGYTDLPQSENPYGWIRQAG
ncbi:MAG: hypothetical protein JW828_03350 [Sedimentisphaerales bacterium]|nr:hypothetical protein [Sedimentisphaerales bacterium]